MTPVEILYEDQALFVVVKPPGMPSQPERSAAMDMVSYLKNLLADRDGMKNPYVGVVHRLDRPVGGVMVYAKNQQSAAALCAQVAGRTIQKEYLAVVSGTMPEPSGTLTDWLVKDGRTNLSRVVDARQKAGSSCAADVRQKAGSLCAADARQEAGSPCAVDARQKAGSLCAADDSGCRPPVKGAKKAVLDYETLESAAGQDGYSLLRIRLHTGRHHQIRVQLAHSGHPLAGDGRYRTVKDSFRELGLFACRLEFVHPVDKKKMSFEARPQAAPFLMFDAYRSAL